MGKSARCARREIQLDMPTVGSDGKTYKMLLIPVEKGRRQMNGDDSIRVRKPRPRAQMLAPKELAKSPHAKKAMAKLIASGRASCLIENLPDLMAENRPLASAISTVLQGYRKSLPKGKSK
jgi:hypothetical protein